MKFRAKLPTKRAICSSTIPLLCSEKCKILAAKLLLTSKEIVRTDLLLRQKAQQSRQFIAEMFLLFLEFFG